MGYLDKLFHLEGKVAAVIGAGGFLCSEMASALAKAGCKVAVIDKNLENAQKIAAEIGQKSFELDVTDKQQHEAVLEAVIKKYGGVDILINGAGINAPTPFLDISVEEWNEIISVTLTGTMLGC